MMIMNDNEWIWYLFEIKYIIFLRDKTHYKLIIIFSNTTTYHIITTKMIDKIKI